MILLGLGSNLSSSFGDRFKNIDLAILFLKRYKIRLIKKSSYYETPSYPNIAKPKFINVIIGIESNLQPLDLAPILIDIEETLERKRDQKNDPRTCDIDIIDYNGQIIDFKYKNLDFTVPHKKLAYRNFVLFPLQEILPEWKHPKTKDHIIVLIRNLSNEDKKSILKINKS